MMSLSQLNNIEQRVNSILLGMINLKYVQTRSHLVIIILLIEH